jgi:diguanylate cyclase (GGDEF)-like protein
MRSSKLITRDSEVVPLSQRLTYLDLFRCALAIVVAVSTNLLRPEIVDRFDVLTVTGLYAMISIVGGILWRVLKRRSLTLFGALIIVDGIYLAWITYATGSTESPFRYFILLHLITVALLASYRTSLKLALWHTLLLLATFHLTREGILPSSGEVQGDATRTYAFIAVFWLAAFLTATLAAVNERELRRRTVDVEALSVMATELETTTDASALTEVLASNVQRHFGAQRVAVLKVEDRRLAPWGFAGEPKGPDTAFEARRNSILVEVLRHRGTALLRRFDAQSDPGLAALLPDAHNLVLVPMTADKGLVGILVVEYGEGTSRVARRDVEMLERFASHGALALRNAILIQQMEELASVDALTSVANRRTFDSVIDNEIKRAGRYGKPVSLILADIDHFKALNDTYGHKMGDRALQQVASVLSKNVRDIDLVSRYGGEEFAIVLPNCSAADAAVRAEELRKAVARDLKSNKLTVSFGVASYPSHAPGADILVVAADRALYQSKCDGRNRVTTYSAGPKALASQTEAKKTRRTSGGDRRRRPGERPGNREAKKRVA